MVRMMNWSAVAASAHHKMDNTSRSSSAVDDDIHTSRQETSLKKHHKKHEKKSREPSAEEAKQLLLHVEQFQNSLKTELVPQNTLRYLTLLSLSSPGMEWLHSNLRESLLSSPLPHDNILQLLEVHTEKAAVHRSARALTLILCQILHTAVKNGSINADSRQRLSFILKRLPAAGYLRLFPLVIDREAAEPIHCRNIESMISCSRPLDAALVASALNLQDSITDIENVLLQLLQLKEFNKAIAFVRGSSFNIATFIRMLAFQGGKPKLSMRLIQTEGLSVDEFRDVECEALAPTIRWLVYIDKLEEFAEYICSHNPLLQRYCLSQLIRKHKNDAFKRLARAFELHEDPDYEWRYIALPPDPVVSIDRADFLQLHVPIVFVDDEETFHQAEVCLLSAEVRVLGLDAEFMPSFCAGSEKVATLQIAISHVVFVFDMLLPLTASHQRLFASIFRNNSILKIGCGFFNDRRVLHASFPSTTCFDVFEPLLDVRSLPGHIMKGGDMQCGLSKVSEMVLGKGIDKHETISNWSRRPLRASQLRYAALDAHVLLSIHQKIVQERLLTSLN